LRFACYRWGRQKGRISAEKFKISSESIGSVDEEETTGQECAISAPPPIPSRSGGEIAGQVWGYIQAGEVALKRITEIIFIGS